MGKIMFENNDNVSWGLYNQEMDFSVLYQEDTSSVYADKPLSLEDGFWKTKHERGYIDLDFWAEVTSLTVDQILNQAAGVYIWQDPVRYDYSGGDRYAGWISQEQYLMGNLIKKYEEAVFYHEKYGIFEDNLELLKENLPEMIEGEDIHVNLGSPWLLSIEGFVETFIAKLLGMQIPPEITCVPFTGERDIECRSEPDPYLDKYKYGTVRSTAIKNIKDKLNGKPPKVYDHILKPDGKGYTAVLNKEESMEKQKRYLEIDKEFEEYCHANKENEALLPEAYMKSLGYGVCRFDGSRFDFSDVEQKLKLHNHQKDAIVHSLSSPNVLFADCTGAGKTVEYCVSVHEQLRLGLAGKAIVVVPKSCLNAAYEVYKELFAEDRVLCIDPEKEFTPENRAETLALMRSESYQVLFLSSTSFDMLQMSKKYILKKQEDKILNVEIEMNYEPSSVCRRRLKKHLNQLRKEREKLEKNYPDTELCCFDLLGVDLLVVDEAHHYKNVTLNYAVENIVGMNKKGSKKADSMFEKVEYIQNKQGRIIFATATPLPNSMSDLYVLQRYLQPEELRSSNLYHFNDWINTFCESEHSFEVDVDCVNGKFTTRFSRFHNIPELMAMFSQVCHFYQGSEELGLPEFHGYTDIIVKQSDSLRSYMEEISERTEAVRNHDVDRKEDNLLKITVHGRLAALDIRLVNSEALADDENKVRVCARNMAQIYFKYPQCTQIAFSDLSTPKEGFNIYDELKESLAEFGVPQEQIVFIQDADNNKKRAEIERRFNQGQIRILIGSTKKLGTGANVQERLVALHMLDVPWRPADFEQRCGRIIRQGNKCKEVFIFRYITERSFDAYTYQILENKQKFTSQFLSGTLSVLHRSETDCTDTVLSYAEIKALAIGNPLLRQRVEIANSLERTKMHQRRRKKELLQFEEILYQLPKQVEKRQQLIVNTKKDRMYYEKHKEVITREERTAFGEELILALTQNVMKDKERIFCEYQGAEVVLPKHMKEDRKYVFLKFRGSNQYSVNMETDKPLGCCQRLDHCLEGLLTRLDYHEQKLQEFYNREKFVKDELSIGNMYDEEVQRQAEQLREIDELLKEGKTA